MGRICVCFTQIIYWCPTRLITWLPFVLSTLTLLMRSYPYIACLITVTLIILNLSSPFLPQTPLLKSWHVWQTFHLERQLTSWNLFTAKMICSLFKAILTLAKILQFFSFLTACNLGVTMDNQLLFSAQMANLTNLCRYLLYIIRRIWPFLFTKATQLLVQSLFISILDYCNLLLAGLSLSTIHPLHIQLHDLSWTFRISPTQPHCCAPSTGFL